MSCEHSLNTLRYADRVKELAADPMMDTGSGNKGTQNNGGSANTISPLMEEEGQEDDLAQLRSLNVCSFSYDVFSFF
jgi:kinesin family protein 2/24